jgi:tetratricopeptide (TPR) repeat protein
MFRKSIISLFAVMAFAVFSTASYAQTAPVSGKVELVKADNTREPVEGATVEPIRMDMKGTLPAAKTNKKGEFVFAGVPLGGTFVLAVSGPNLTPTYLPNVKAGQEKLLISITAGDGSRLDEARIRADMDARAAGADSPEAAADRKKAQAEYEAKLKEVAAKNQKIEKTNELKTRVLKEGNEAYTAKNYDVAIARYTEGIDADPEFVGSAPIFYNNRGAALQARAVNTYNTAIKSAEPSAKVEGLKAAKSDFAEAVAGYLKAWQVLKNAQPTEIGDKTAYETAKLNALKGAGDAFRLAVKTEQVDPQMLEAAKVLMPELMAAEADVAKKAEAQLVLADLYRVAQQREEAIAAYRKVLEIQPENVDALAGVGLVLVDLSWLKDNDKVLAQEGANFLQRFVALAPDTHKLKDGAKGYLDILKTQNVVPVKTAPASRRRP